MAPRVPGSVTTALFVVCILAASAGVAAQNLATTCPVVAAAKCPGTCTPVRRLIEAEIGGGGRGEVDDPFTAALKARRLQQDAATAAAGGVPQRVRPADAAQARVPPETPAQQAAIVSHLQALMAGWAAAPSASAGGSGGGGGGSTHKAPATSNKTSLTAAHSQSLAAAGRSTAASGSDDDTAAATTAATTDVPLVPAPQQQQRQQRLRRRKRSLTAAATQVSRVLTFVESPFLRLGADLARAGAVSWLSSPLMPAPWTNVNLINTWDAGRLVQQSYYGCVDGSCWATRPWLFNPVQGGSWQNRPSKTTRQEVVPGRSLYVEGTPRNWGGQELARDLTLSANISVLASEPTVAALRAGVAYRGNATHPYMTQEVPAVFVDRRLGVLAYYAGPRPWTGDAALTYAFPPGRNIYATPTERWAAYIDPATGWGVGVYQPDAWLGITAYRVGADGSANAWDCSYAAFTIRMQLWRGMRPYNYTAYVTAGRLDVMRATFARLQAALAAGQQPVRSSSASSSSSSSSTAGGAPLFPGVVGPQPDLGRNAAFGRVANYSAAGDYVVFFDNDDATTLAAAAAGASGSGSGGSNNNVTGADARAAAAAAGAAAAAADGSGAQLSGGNGSGGGGGGGAGARVGTIVGAVLGAAGGCALLAGAALAVTRRLGGAAAAGTVVLRNALYAANNTTNGDDGSVDGGAGGGGGDVVDGNSGNGGETAEAPQRAAAELLQRNGSR